MHPEEFKQRFPPVIQELNKTHSQGTEKLRDRFCGLRHKQHKEDPDI